MIRGSYIGDIKEGNIINTSQGKCLIINYINANQVFVKFLETGGISEFTAGNLRKGKVKDPLARTASGVGFIGKGKKDIKNKKAYQCWVSILERCYNKNSKIYKNYGGKGVRVDESWYNFCNFEEFYIKNNPRNLHIDKDLIKPYSKVYSEETCCFVPQKLNNIILNFPTENSIHFDKVRSKYCVSVSCKSGKKSKRFNTSEEALFWYKKVKLNVLEEYLNELEYEGIINKYLLRLIIDNYKGGYYEK